MFVTGDMPFVHKSVDHGSLQKDCSRYSVDPTGVMLTGSRRRDHEKETTRTSPR